MAKFTQQFFQPGWWNVGGKPMRFTKGELSDRCDNTDEFIKANPAGGVPIFPKHPLAGSVGGGPRVADRDARDCLGWVDSTRMDAEGKCHVTYDVQDQRTIDGINSGTIRFSSPEFSTHDHKDSRGRNFGRIFRHFAMTAAPRNREQGKITSAQFSEDCIQFSEDDFMGATKKDVEAKAAEEKATQFAHDDETKKKIPEELAAETLAPAETEVSAIAEETASEEPPTNETETKVSSEHPDQQVLNGLTMQIMELSGIVLPEGADTVALLTAIANKMKADKENADALSGDIKIEEEPVAQFSEEATAVIEALQGRIAASDAKEAATAMAQHRADIVATIATAKIPKLMKSRLTGHAASIQFAEGGEEEPRFTVAQVIELVSDCIPASLTQFSEETAVEEEHPDAEEGFFKGGDGPAEESDEEAEKGVDEQLERSGMGDSGFGGKSKTYSRDFTKVPAGA